MLIHLIACRVMGLPNRLQVGLHMAQVGHATLQRIHSCICISLELELVGLALRALQKPQLVLFERHIGLQGFVLLRDLGLLFQLVQIGVEFAQDVFHAGEVFAGVGEAVFRLAAALFVFGNARGFFQKQAQLFGLALNDAADGALANDGVGTWPQASAQEHVLHVATAHGLVVDVVAAGAVAGEHALDGNFGELRPLAARAVICVVKHQLHAGAAGGLAGGGAVKNHVLHGLAAQFAGAALPQYPAHRVHDVGLAAAVGPNHAHELPRQQKIGGFGEGLEAG